ncbi:MAG: tRNA pseudouridine(38-40) synthase TruA, partial [Oscillospiraceae bacterium]
IRNILIEMSYNGSKYHGYQVQKNALAITEVVQDVIEKILKKRENIIGCSRTDTGVHANSYFFNIKTESKIPCNKLIQVFNRALPDDIVFLSCKDVPLDFHSRYNCIGKEYIYKIYDTDLKNPFLSDLALYYPEKLDVDLLNKKAQVLVGKHDFIL